MKITKQHLNKNKFSQIKVLLFVVASFLILGVKIYLEIVNKLKKKQDMYFQNHYHLGPNLLHYSNKGQFISKCIMILNWFEQKTTIESLHTTNPQPNTKH